MLSAASLHNSTLNSEEMCDLKTKSVDGRLPSARPPMVSNFGILQHIKVLEDNASSATKINLTGSKNKELYHSVDSTSRNNQFMKLLSHKQAQTEAHNSVASVALNTERSRSKIKRAVNLS